MTKKKKYIASKTKFRWVGLLRITFGLFVCFWVREFQSWSSFSGLQSLWNCRLLSNRRSRFQNGPRLSLYKRSLCARESSCFLLKTLRYRKKDYRRDLALLSFQGIFLRNRDCPSFWKWRGSLPNMASLHIWTSTWNGATVVVLPDLRVLEALVEPVSMLPSKVRDLLADPRCQILIVQVSCLRWLVSALLAWVLAIEFSRLLALTLPT